MKYLYKFELLRAIDYPDPRTGQRVTGNVNPNNPFASGDNGNGNGRAKKKAANAANIGITTPTIANDQRNLSPSATDPYAVNLQDVEISKLPFKIKREFEPIVLDTLFETAGPIVQLIDAGVIDETKARDILHFQDIEARMKEAEAERQKQQMLMQQQMGLDPNNPQNNNNKDNNQKQNPFQQQKKQQSGIAS
jgi:hypothetical protein